MPYFEACQTVRHMWTHPEVVLRKSFGDFEPTFTGRTITEESKTTFCAEGSTERSAKEALAKIISGKHVKWAEPVKVTKERTWGEFFRDVAVGMDPYASGKY